MSFSRLNLLSWWLFLIGGLLALVSVFSPRRGGGYRVDLLCALQCAHDHQRPACADGGIFTLGFSSILTGFNFITTVHRLRAPGMTFFRMPLFVWALYATAWVQVLATPIIGITLLLVVIERVVRSRHLRPAMGGDPILYQHLFWIYSHPAVYIMILPPMGIVSEIIPVFARKPSLATRSLPTQESGIASVGSLVWGITCLPAARATRQRYVFSFLTFLVAVPSAIKVFNWVATLHRGSIDPKSPFSIVSLSFSSFP